MRTRAGINAKTWTGRSTLLNGARTGRGQAGILRPSPRHLSGEFLASYRPDKPRDARKPQGISFVIVTYNSLETIEECLTSVQAQKTGPFEVFVVDNASLDGTSNLVESKFPGA